jgi:hypothetical protein
MTKEPNPNQTPMTKFQIPTEEELARYRAIFVLTMADSIQHFDRRIEIGICVGQIKGLAGAKPPLSQPACSVDRHIECALIPLAGVGTPVKNHDSALLVDDHGVGAKPFGHWDFGRIRLPGHRAFFLPCFCYNRHP